MFTCPVCTAIVGQYPDGGVTTLVCARCTFKYELSGGTCVALHSQTHEVRRAVSDGPALLARRFELSIATSLRETLRFTFETDRNDDWIRIAPGDRTVVVYTMRAEAREELLFIVNRTTGERFVLGKPGQRSKSRAVLYGALSAAIAGTSAALLSAPFAIAVGLALVAGVAATKGIGYALRPRHRLATDEQLALTARQSLLVQKKSLLASRSVVLDEVENRRTLGEKLRSLRSRMVAVKLDAYASRIAQIDRALQVLQEQLAMDDRLLGEYDRTMQILDIEYESSLTADALPADSAAIMESRVAELHMAEELRAEVTRTLAANDEVEQLLRSHSA